MSVVAEQPDRSRCHLAIGMDVGSCPDPALLPQKGGRVPLFSTHFYCGQAAGCIKVPLGMEVGLGSGDIVLDGDPGSPQKGQGPQFSAHVYCGQTTVCIRIALGLEVGLSLGNIVLDPAPLP